MEEWDQRRADNRDLATMRRIALDAMELKDDDAAFYDYADEHHLTVNEVAYYLNAYEAGGEAGRRERDLALPAEPETRGRSRLFKA
jgi:hypothetical protein